MDPKELSAGLASLANLLVRVSGYLSVRLPAEITLPHDNYPLPTIFKVGDSYQARPQDIPFPGTTVSASGYNSPSPSRTFQRPLPRPRLLWIDKKLSQLAKDDQAAFALFVEGCCLLAWNIAWLCRSQSSTVALESWEDICAMGRNLYQLVVADPSKRKASRRESAGRAGQSPAKNGKQPDSAAADSGDFFLGNLSHGTAHSFLGSAEGARYMRDWRIKNPNELSSRVRSALLSDMQGAEWEMIDEQDERAEEAPELIGTKAGSNDSGAGGKKKQTIMRESNNNNGTIRAGDTAADGRDSTSSQGRPKGVNGWTKVKSRSGEMGR